MSRQKKTMPERGPMVGELPQRVVGGCFCTRTVFSGRKLLLHKQSLACRELMLHPNSPQRGVGDCRAFEQLLQQLLRIAVLLSIAPASRQELPRP